MNLPTLDKTNTKGKRVLLRLDLDVPLEDGKVLDDTRLKNSISTIKHLVEEGSGRITILGHLGRPKGEIIEALSLAPVGEKLEELLRQELGSEVIKNLDIFMMENLRFDPGEEGNDEEFAKELAQHGEVYVNDAFANSHRKHASIVTLPGLVGEKAAGFHLATEVQFLRRVLENPKGPAVMVLGGGKLDKAELVDKLLDHADWVLVGGVLPKLIDSYCRMDDAKMCVSAAGLTSNQEDITENSARNFIEIIKEAGTIVWNGPMGDIDKNYWKGTEIVGQAIAESRAYKVAGGGDTERVLKKLGILDKMDFVSTGGGAMLEFLAFGDLPGLKALRN